MGKCSQAPPPRCYVLITFYSHSHAIWLVFDIQLDHSHMSLKATEWWVHPRGTARAHHQKIKEEITETALMEDNKNAFNQLATLNKMGITISIDDFGTGYSSLSCLHQLPVDYLKIDRSFIADIFNEHSSAPIVNTIINLAHNLKLKVVGEGVETEAQLIFLQEHGCDYVQGYLFSKPLPPEEIIALHSKQKTANENKHGHNKCARNDNPSK